MKITITYAHLAVTLIAGLAITALYPSGKPPMPNNDIRSYCEMLSAYRVNPTASNAHVYINCLATYKEHN